MLDSAAPVTAFAAISDGSRRHILDLLAESDMTVSELCAHFDMSQPAVSKHLRVLREAGLVSAQRDGRTQVYRLEAKGLRDVYDWVAHYERFWSDKLVDLGRYLDEAPRNDDDEKSEIPRPRGEDP